MTAKEAHERSSKFKKKPVPLDHQLRTVYEIINHRSGLGFFNALAPDMSRGLRVALEAEGYRIVSEFIFWESPEQ